MLVFWVSNKQWHHHRHPANIADTTAKNNIKNASSRIGRQDNEIETPMSLSDEDKEKRNTEFNEEDVERNSAPLSRDFNVKDRAYVAAQPGDRQLLHISVGDVRAKIWTALAAAITEGIGHEASEELATTTLESTTIVQNTPAENTIDEEDR